MTITYDSDENAPEGSVTVKVYLTEANYEKLREVAIRLGDTRTDTINRAIAFYATVTACKPGTTLNWADSDGTQHELAILA